MTDTPTLKLYNSLTRTKEDFVPADPKRVTMYNCGPTVYSYAHIGNARAAVVADVLFRVLRHIYGEAHVIYSRNLTDVDDKIIAASKEQGVSITEITEKFAKIYQDDLAALGCLTPTHQPKATDNIGNMIEMISGLIKDGFAYESQGHVFFDVSQYDAYGKLSGNTMDALKSAGRVGEGETARKNNPADFVLWKPELDGVGWEAPFGKGRPGWHIECSAMIKETLGETIDIHCGGVDLKFPHHENEIAQSECSHGGKTLANYWVHNEFLNLDSEKMSKSLGNVKLIHDLRKDWDGEVIRLALLKAHYRSELIWSEDLLKESKAQLDSWYRLLQTHNSQISQEEHQHHSLGELLDDLGTPQLLSTLSQQFDTISKMAGKSENQQSPDIAQQLVKSCRFANLLGLLQVDPEDWFKGGLDTDKFDAMAAQYDAIRAQAVAAKKDGDKTKMGDLFSKADAIRDALKQDGVALETGPNGSSWRKA